MIYPDPLTEDGMRSRFSATDERWQVEYVDIIDERFWEDIESWDQVAAWTCWEGLIEAREKAYREYCVNHSAIRHKCPACGQNALCFISTAIIVC